MNFLFTTIVKELWNKEDIRYLKDELDIDSLYIVTGEKSELEVFSEFDGCICQHDCRVGDYEEYYEKYINKYYAVDEKLLNDFAQYMPEIMLQMMRDENPYRYQIDKTFDGRYRLLLKHIRFWYSFIMEKKIDYIVFQDAPHAGFDYVLYNLCKVLPVKSVCVFFDFIHARRRFVIKDFESFDEVYQTAKKEVDSLLANGEELVLSEELEKELNQLGSGRQEDMTRAITDFCITTTEKYIRVYYGYHSIWDYWRYIYDYSYSSYSDTYSRPVAIFKTLRVAFPSAIEGLKRRNTQYARIIYKKTRKFLREYNKKSIEPDYSCKYVYYAFHYLPERTSSPMGGRLYADQSVAISIISESIPDDWKIYVKVHPGQLGVVCTMDTMNDLLNIPKVQLIKKDAPTLELTKHAQSVATLTGHVALEAQYLNIPALVFGITDLRYAPLSYYVRTVDECKQAIEEIINNPRTTNLEELKKFLLVHNHYTYFYDRERIAKDIKRVIAEYEGQENEK